MNNDEWKKNEKQNEINKSLNKYGMKLMDHEINISLNENKAHFGSLRLTQFYKNITGETRTSSVIFHPCNEKRISS